MWLAREILNMIISLRDNWSICWNGNGQDDDDRNNIDIQTALALPMNTVPPSPIPSLSRLNEDDGDSTYDSSYRLIQDDINSICNLSPRPRSKSVPQMTLRKSPHKKFEGIRKFRPPLSPQCTPIRRQQIYHERWVDLNIIPSYTGDTRFHVQSMNKNNHRQAFLQSPAIWISLDSKASGVMT